MVQLVAVCESRLNVHDCRQLFGLDFLVTICEEEKVKAASDTLCKTCCFSDGRFAHFLIVLNFGYLKPQQVLRCLSV